MTMQPYTYWRLDRRMEGQNGGWYEEVAVSRKPILKESARLFGRGEYRITMVVVVPLAESMGSLYSSKKRRETGGNFQERTIIEFRIHQDEVDRGIVDLDMLNMNLMANMADKIKNDILSQRRSIQR